MNLNRKVSSNMMIVGKAPLEKKQTRKSKKTIQTRATLIKAARKVFARDGFGAARIVDIAGEAGKAVGLFYTYFSSKNELFEALVDEFYTELISTSVDPKPYKDDPRALVRADVEQFWATYNKYRGDVAGLFEIAPTDPHLMDVWKKMRARGTLRIKRAIRRQQIHGHCKDLDPELAASAILGLLEFTCFNWQTGHLDFADTPADERAVETLITLIVNTLELKPEDAIEG